MAAVGNYSKKEELARYNSSGWLFFLASKFNRKSETLMISKIGVLTIAEDRIIFF